MTDEPTCAECGAEVYIKDYRGLGRRYQCERDSEHRAGAPPFAIGGVIRGPGAGTGDSALAQLFGGCYEVHPAVNLERHRTMLDAINEGGTMPPFARGGFIDGTVA